MKRSVFIKCFMAAELCLVGFAAVAAIEEREPVLRGLCQSDYAAGIVLARVGTGESFDFNAPADAVICQEWELVGAARDWFTASFGENACIRNGRMSGWKFRMADSSVGSFTVFSHGTVRPAITNATTCISPLNANLGVVPKSNYHLLDAKNTPSAFWHRFTPEDTLVLTWQNVLFERDVRQPVSFQVEIERNGTMTFRYDLSRLAGETVDNVQVGVLNGGNGRLFTSLPRNLTSLRWAYLKPHGGMANDHDQDGISTSDEIFVHFTDPYAADTDGDGLTDYFEINEYGSDPCKAYSVDSRFNDRYAYALDGLEPYFQPHGDGFTALENIYYTGNVHGRAEKGESTIEYAVLKVSASDNSGGTMTIDGKEVPLFYGVDPLEVKVRRGVVHEWTIRGSATVRPVFDSEEFCIGDRDSWIAFPCIDATHPCLHTVDSNEKIVTLKPGLGMDGLSCTWAGDGNSVSIERLSSLSAKITTHFKRNSSASITYTLSHPKYLFGKTTYKQSCHYCPPIADDEDEYSSTKDYHGGYYFFNHGCADYCFRHKCERYVCRTLWHPSSSTNVCESLSMENPTNSSEYAAALASPCQFVNVLKLHRPYEVNERYNFKLNGVAVPDEKYECCECCEHWSSFASIAYKSHRLAVHQGGQPFVRTTEDCELTVVGTSPSENYEDAGYTILVNDKSKTWNYTVFGVSILAKDRNIRLLNELDVDFGLPVTLTSGFNEVPELLRDATYTSSGSPLASLIRNGETLQLATDVLLPNGNVRLAFEDASAHLQLWMRIENGGYALLLDSETKPSMELSILDWRTSSRYATSDLVTDVQLVALPSSTNTYGSARLYFGYAGGKNGKYLHDEATQAISVIRPPLLPDYNRDGIIDDKDELLYISGKRLYFWANEDTWSGDDAFAPYSEGVHIFAYQLPINGSDGEVNGRNDLVNLCPFAVDVTRFSNIFGVHNISVSVTGNDLDNVQFVGTHTAWAEVGKIVSEDQTTVKGKALHSAKLEQPAIDGDTGELCYKLPTKLLMLGDSNSGVLAMEFAKPNSETKLNLVVRKSDSGDVIFTQSLDASILDVHKMYRWINLDYVCEEQKPESEKTDEDRARDEKYKTRTDVEWPDTEHADVNVFFAHGFNVHIDEAWDWSQAMFKRLWWSGMDAGFTAIRWYGNHSQIWIPKAWPFITSNGYGSRNYHQNVYNAFRTAGTLATVANSLPGERKYYIAHSLGNMLICAAKQFHGLKYDKYMMLNAAVAMEALDPDAISHENGKACMTPAAWRSYPDRVKSAHWYELFSRSDVRHGLTWKGLFKDVDNVMNFYSEQDEVVRDGNGKWKNPLSRKFAWYNQERAKGSFWVDSNWEAGWAFCENYDIIETGGLWGNTTYARHRTSTESKSISNDQLISDPFFGAFTHPEILGENGDAYFTEHPEYRWRILSHGIPSESFAIGANAMTDSVVKAIGYKKGQHSSARTQNIEMSTQCVREKSKHVKWVHSYFIQWSMKFTGILYDKIVANSSTTKGK